MVVISPNIVKENGNYTFGFKMIMTHLIPAHYVQKDEKIAKELKINAIDFTNTLNFKFNGKQINGETFFSNFDDYQSALKYIETLLINNKNTFH